MGHALDVSLKRYAPQKQRVVQRPTRCSEGKWTISPSAKRSGRNSYDALSLRLCIPLRGHTRLYHYAPKVFMEHPADSWATPRTAFARTFLRRKSAGRPCALGAPIQNQGNVVKHLPKTVGVQTPFAANTACVVRGLAIDTSSYPYSVSTRISHGTGCRYPHAGQSSPGTCPPSSHCGHAVTGRLALYLAA